MKRVYACLLGNWIDITNEGLLHNRNPLTYINEEIQDMFEYDYINVQYDNKNYRIHPSLIQVVSE
ncbi:hypothetical protein ACSXC4_01755 [Clostridium perfringens]|uniref:Uncharacterized protein n=1 Tax=Clostridium perfringens TaxID=1502 RepID=A0A127EGU2_CLOPF|nr:MULTISPECIES: hypothetical protein [Clostridium]AMN35147.1 hypothetical protein JFP838_05060 [Clostridium perfringens]EHP50411.1 hypothetical protein HMPREF9476_00363 [Clostridium perfringens WAL-14572]ELC8386657.1 hypothetical protein [Clostridium perfringens]ELC8392679.1 hypothetical protein [Clostridium perfringens]ELC8406202.1 hypothetical protein [Clostridium perfringens]